MKSKDAKKLQRSGQSYQNIIQYQVKPHGTKEGARHLYGNELTSFEDNETSNDNDDTKQMAKTIKRVSVKHNYKDKSPTITNELGSEIRAIQGDNEEYEYINNFSRKQKIEQLSQIIDNIQVIHQNTI